MDTGETGPPKGGRYKSRTKSPALRMTIKNRKVRRRQS